MTLKRIKEIHQDYKNALRRLVEALEEDLSAESIVVDAVIQRFEFTFELAWKAAKHILNYSGIEAETPRLVIKEAFKTKMIQGGQGWIDMLEDRNKTSHIYDEKEALRIYKKIRNNHFSLLQDFEKNISEFLRVK